MVFFLLDTLKATVKTPVVDLFRLNNLAAAKTAFQPLTGTCSISVFYMEACPGGSRYLHRRGSVNLL